MAVNDVRVRRIIDEALIMFSTESGCCGPLRAAFRELQRLRRLPGGSVDEDLAAAEHHMFARYTVCVGTVSPAQMEAMVVGYDTIKGIVQLVPAIEELMRTTSNPTAPASAASILWGLRGVSEGRAQHGRCNGSVTPPVFNSDIYNYGSSYY